jgi:hypothetical protein
MEDQRKAVYQKIAEDIRTFVQLGDLDAATSRLIDFAVEANRPLRNYRAFRYSRYVGQFDYKEQVVILFFNLINRVFVLSSWVLLAEGLYYSCFGSVFIIPVNLIGLVLFFSAVSDYTNAIVLGDKFLKIIINKHTVLLFLICIIYNITYHVFRYTRISIDGINIFLYIEKIYIYIKTVLYVPKILLKIFLIPLLVTVLK